MSFEDDADLDPWQRFWLASELSPATGAAFAHRINDLRQAGGGPLSRFVYPGADPPPPPP